MSIAVTIQDAGFRVLEIFQYYDARNGERLAKCISYVGLSRVKGKINTDSRCLFLGELSKRLP